LENASEKQKYFFHRSSGSIPGPTVEIATKEKPQDQWQDISKKKRPRTSVPTADLLA
jgi:hypothetical protein